MEKTRYLVEAEMIIGNDISLRNDKTKDCITSTEVARSMGMECFDLLMMLEDLGVVVFKNRHYELAPEMEGRGLAMTRYFFCFSRAGRRLEKPHIVWTKAGVKFIKEAITPSQPRGTRGCFKKTIKC